MNRLTDHWPTHQPTTILFSWLWVRVSSPIRLNCGYPKWFSWKKKHIPAANRRPERVTPYMIGVVCRFCNQGQPQIFDIASWRQNNQVATLYSRLVTWFISNDSCTWKFLIDPANSRLKSSCHICLIIINIASTFFYNFLRAYCTEENIFFPDNRSHLISNFHVLQIEEERSLKKTSIALSRTKLVLSGFNPEISSCNVHTTHHWANEEAKCCKTMKPSSTVQREILPLMHSQSVFNTVSSHCELRYENFAHPCSFLSLMFVPFSISFPHHQTIAVGY